MSACERCWADAGRQQMAEPSRSKADIYRELIEQRVGPLACTPEQQAGEDADKCPICMRRTLHQFTGLCMNEWAHP